MGTIINKDISELGGKEQDLSECLGRRYAEKKYTLKWMKNTLWQTLKLIQERVGNTLGLVGIGKNFFNETPAAQQLRGSIDKWDLIKLKSFCSSEEMVSTLNRTPTDWEKIFASYTSDKGLITRIYRELKKLNSPKTNEPIKK
jgi:hypothetical protein